MAREADGVRLPTIIEVQGATFEGAWDPRSGDPAPVFGRVTDVQETPDGRKLVKVRLTGMDT